MIQTNTVLPEYPGDAGALQEDVIGQLGAEGRRSRRCRRRNRYLTHTKRRRVLSNSRSRTCIVSSSYTSASGVQRYLRAPARLPPGGSLYPIIRKSNNLEKIALHYFEKNNFKEAIEAYNLLAAERGDQSETWQRIGYSKQMLGDMQGALEAYLHADLIEENNTWILNRIAYCYRVLKEPVTALEYYRRLEQFRPDDMAIQLNIGHCYLELKQYDEALNYYFKVELLGNAGSRWRPIAWCVPLPEI